MLPNCRGSYSLVDILLISAWDTSEEKGTQTVNAIVLVELGGENNDIVLDAQSEQ